MLHKSNKFLTSLLICLFCSAPGISQISDPCNIHFEGDVLDLETNSSLESVRVNIKELNLNIQTDFKGYFEIKDICPGNYIGLSNIVMTRGRSSGTLNVNLKHQPGIKDGHQATGESDIDITFQAFLK